MFKCSRCGRTTNPCEKLTKLVTDTKEKTYYNKFIKKGKEIEKISHGYEILREIDLCERCAEEKKQSEEVLKN